jgi:hypothetical protein
MASVNSTNQKSVTSGLSERERSFLALTKDGREALADAGIGTPGKPGEEDIAAIVSNPRMRTLLEMTDTGRQVVQDSLARANVA